MDGLCTIIVMVKSKSTLITIDEQILFNMTLIFFQLGGGILLVLTWIASSTIIVRKGKGDKTRTIPLARVQKESLTKWLEIREDYAREIKSEALFITRLGTRYTGEIIRKIIKSLKAN